MRIPTFTLQMLVCMCLFVPAAYAEDFSIPDKEHRQGMSYEEYSRVREKMRKHIESVPPEAQQQEASSRGAEASAKTQHDSRYGQGYHSRNEAADRPDVPDIPAIDAGSRPDRPHIERFNRSDMGRR